jgi:hypothetical protein
MRRIVGETDASAGQRIDVGCGDLRAVTADIGPAHIVHKDDHNVRRPRRRAHRQIPVGLRFLARSSDFAGKTRIAPCLAGNGDFLQLIEGWSAGSPPLARLLRKPPPPISIFDIGGVMGTNVNLTRELERFAQACVESGRGRLGLAA